jgi:hypothetical protein
MGEQRDAAVGAPPHRRVAVEGSGCDAELGGLSGCGGNHLWCSKEVGGRRWTGGAAGALPGPRAGPEGWPPPVEDEEAAGDGDADPNQSRRR